MTVRCVDCGDPAVVYDVGLWLCPCCFSRRKQKKTIAPMPAGP